MLYYYYISKYIVKLAILSIPIKGQEEDNENRVIKYLDERMFKKLKISINTKYNKEVLRMGKTQRKFSFFYGWIFKKISRRCKYDI